MIFNGKFVFCQFPMLFNGNLRLEKPWGGEVWTYGRLEIHPCVLQDIGPLGPFGTAAQKRNMSGWMDRPNKRQPNRFMDRYGQMNGKERFLLTNIDRNIDKSIVPSIDRWSLLIFSFQFLYWQKWKSIRLNLAGPLTLKIAGRNCRQMEKWIISWIDRAITRVVFYSLKSSSSSTYFKSR